LPSGVQTLLEGRPQRDGPRVAEEGWRGAARSRPWKKEQAARTTATLTYPEVVLAVVSEPRQLPLPPEAW